MTIRIEHLEFDAIIGLLDFERDRPQRVRIDLTATYDYQPGTYLDYAKMVEAIKAHIIEQKYELLEEALEGLHTILRTAFPPIDTLEITIAKPDILSDCVVALNSVTSLSP